MSESCAVLAVVLVFLVVQAPLADAAEFQLSFREQHDVHVGAWVTVAPLVAAASSHTRLFMQVDTGSSITVRGHGVRKRQCHEHSVTAMFDAPQCCLPSGCLVEDAQWSIDTQARLDLVLAQRWLGRQPLGTGTSMPAAAMTPRCSPSTCSTRMAQVFMVTTLAPLSLTASRL